MQAVVHPDFMQLWNKSMAEKQVLPFGGTFQRWLDENILQCITIRESTAIRFEDAYIKDDSGKVILLFNLFNGSVHKMPN